MIARLLMVENIWENLLHIPLHQWEQIELRWDYRWTDSCIVCLYSSCRNVPYLFQETSKVNSQIPNDEKHKESRKNTSVNVCSTYDLSNRYSLNRSDEIDRSPGKKRATSAVTELEMGTTFITGSTKPYHCQISSVAEVNSNPSISFHSWVYQSWEYDQRGPQHAKAFIQPQWFGTNVLGPKAIFTQICWSITQGIYLSIQCVLKYQSADINSPVLITV